jgi:hypothetical protein
VITLQNGAQCENDRSMPGIITVGDCEFQSANKPAKKTIKNRSVSKKIDFM